MRTRSLLMPAGVCAAIFSVLAAGQAPRRQRLNPVIGLLEQNKPVFGVYAPSSSPPGGRRSTGSAQASATGSSQTPGRADIGAPGGAPPALKRPLDLAREALAY